MTLENPGPGLGYAQKCGRAKLVNEIQILLSRKLDLSPMAIHINKHKKLAQIRFHSKDHILSQRLMTTRT
jgi:hypothetical protein